MSRPRRIDSLFGRLMLMQGLLLALVLVLLWLLVVAERNIKMAPYHAQNWAPRIRSALASPGTALAPELAEGFNMRLSDTRPAQLWLRVGWVPAAQSVRAELARLNLQVGEPYLDWRNGQPVLWAAVADGSAPARWVSVSAREGFPTASIRLPVELLLLLAVSSLLSLYIARRITGPIEQLRRHMHDQAQPGRALGSRPPPALPAHAALEVRDMHADYSRLLAQLQRQERERITLLAGVSHDLRSPLGRIRLAAEMLPEVAANHDGVAVIIRNVDHADLLIGSFLDFVRAGELPLDEQVDLSAVLRQAVDRFGRPAQQLQLQAPPQLMLARANALLIDRLVFNLVDNALKHGLPPVRVVLASQPAGVVIDVTDQGTGLAAAGGPGLMEAFARGDGSRQVPGFGLGLAVVQHIAHRLQGTLLSFCDAGGHTLRITLPHRGAARAEASA